MEQSGRHSNGTFAPGHSGFKRKGVPELQRATREKLWEFFESKIQDLPVIFENLSDRDKAKILLTIAEFFLPKTRVIVDEREPQSEGIDFTTWPDAEKRKLIQIIESNTEKYGSN